MSDNVLKSSMSTSAEASDSEGDDRSAYELSKAREKALQDRIQELSNQVSEERSLRKAGAFRVNFMGQLLLI